MAGFVAFVAGLLIALYICWRIIQRFFDVLLWAADRLWHVALLA